MSQVKSLSVHKNTLERKRRKSVRSDMVTSAKAMGANAVAYAIVTIDEDGSAHAAWDTGSAMPMWAFPETMAAALRRSVEESGVEETWKPSLSERFGSTSKD